MQRSTMANDALHAPGGLCGRQLRRIGAGLFVVMEDVVDASRLKKRARLLHRVARLDAVDRDALRHAAVSVVRTAG